MIRDRRAAAWVAIVLSSLAAGIGAAPAAAGQRGVFVSHCAYSHSLRDDPIMHPGDPGASHRHDFFGSTETSATSTVQAMRRGATTCLLGHDTAGYWFPAAYVGGRRTVPSFSKIYYFGVQGRAVEPIPRRLQWIGGNPTASSTDENPHATWSCGARGARRTPIVDHPYDCSRFARRWGFVDGVVGRVDLPSCWDGAGRGPSDVTYPEGGACPAGFDDRLPVIRMQVHLGILDPCRAGAPCRAEGAGGAVVLRLSSGPYYTLHADYWNTWHQDSLEHLINRCDDKHVRCGVVVDR